MIRASAGARMSKKGDPDDFAGQLRLIPNGLPGSGDINLGKTSFIK
jgi:hypothetical protein